MMIAEIKARIEKAYTDINEAENALGRAMYALDKASEAISDLEKPAEPVEAPEEPQPTEPAPPTGAFPFGNFDWLKENGFFLRYENNDSTAPLSRYDMETFTPTGQGGARQEIAVIDGVSAHWLATGDLAAEEWMMKHASTIPLEDWDDREKMRTSQSKGGWGLDFAHTPNCWWVPFLMTGNKDFLKPMEKIHRWYMEHFWGRLPENQPKEFYAQGYNNDGVMPWAGRDGAWQLRNLAQLAKLQEYGLTEHDYYIEALENTLDFLMTEFVFSSDPVKINWRVIGWNKGNWARGSYYFTGWQEPYIGTVLAHIINMGFGGFRILAEWHFDQLPDLIENWGWRGFDHDDYSLNSIAEAAGVPLAEATRANLPPYPVLTDEFLAAPFDELLPYNLKMPKGSSSVPYHYKINAQFCYSWAAAMAQIGLAGADYVADEILAQIEKAGLKLSPRTHISKRKWP